MQGPCSEAWFAKEGNPLERVGETGSREKHIGIDSYTVHFLFFKVDMIFSRAVFEQKTAQKKMGYFPYAAQERVHTLPNALRRLMSFVAERDGLHWIFWGFWNYDLTFR